MATLTTSKPIVTVHWLDAYHAAHVDRMEINESWLTRGKESLRTLIALKLGRVSTITLIKHGATEFIYKAEY